MKEVRGSSPLTDEQRDWYEQHGYGRPAAVQDQPQIASRFERRRRRFRPLDERNGIRRRR